MQTTESGQRDVLQIDEKEKKAIYDKILGARDENDKISARRKVNFEAWARTPYNEQTGRSKYQASDVFDQIESTFPALMGRVLATDHQIRVKGPNQMVAKALLVKARSILDENDSFWLYSCAIKDGLLSLYGAVKMWWSKTYRLEYEQRGGLPLQVAQELRNRYASGDLVDLQIEQEPAPPAAVYDPRDGITGPIVVPVPPTFSATIGAYQVDQSKCVIVPIPPEQVLMERGKASINDGRGCGHQAVKTVGDLIDMQEQLSMPGEPFFDPQEMLKAIKRASKDEAPHQQDEREAREGLHYTILDDGRIEFRLTPGQLRQPVTLVEWSDRVVAGDRLEPALLWYAGDVCLRVQRNKEGIVPMGGWSPYIVPHSVVGMGVAEQHVHEQDTRSALGRALVDYVARTVDEETFILNESTDIMGLKTRVPGQLVYSKPDQDFKRGVSQPLKADLFQAMEWMKTNINDTGPANRWTQGRDVDPRNTTATGQQIMAAASSSKQNMIALVFTEMFQVDVYQKIIRLIQANCDEFTVTVEDQEVTLKNAQMQGSYIAYSETGRQFDLNDRELGRAQLIMGLVDGLAKIGIAGPEQVYNAAKKVMLAAGEPVVADYMLPPGVTFQQMVMQAAQQMVQQAMMGAVPGGQQRALPAPGAMQARPDMAAEQSQQIPQMGGVA